MNKFSRRDFLKISAGALALSPFSKSGLGFDDGSFVRVSTDEVPVYDKPNDESLIVGTHFRDEVIHTYGEVNSGTPTYNPVWYRVWGGYMHRARLQRVTYTYNKPLTSIPNNLSLGEVTVPFTQTYKQNKRTELWEPFYRIYSGSVHWIIGIEEKFNNDTWYILHDELTEDKYIIRAEDMRPISPQEYTPISPDVPFEQKRIDVNIAQQTVTASEYGKPVFSAKISSGAAGLYSGTDGISTATPVGDFHVINKMPSKHMGNTSLASNDPSYILAGVPWVSFFTELGHAFHGTYWHDNFGTPTSHGCINMRNQDAQWIFRWTRPNAGYDDLDHALFDKKGYGTRVVIKSK